MYRLWLFFLCWLCFGRVTGQNDLLRITNPDLRRAIAQIEAKRWSLSWPLYSRLDDTSRFDFLGKMILERVQSPRPDQADLDSAGGLVRLIEPQLSTVRSRYSDTAAYFALAAYCLAAKERTGTLGIVVQCFQDIHRSGDIIAEDLFFDIVTNVLMGDGRFVPAVQTIIGPWIADNDNLLQHLSNADQRTALNLMGDASIKYYNVLRPDIVTRIDSAAIRLNGRLHQHATAPYENLSYLYTMQGRTREAVAVAFETMRVAETPDGPVDGGGYEAACRAYATAEDYDKSLDYGYKALALFYKDAFSLQYPGALVYRIVRLLILRHRAKEALGIVKAVSMLPAYHRLRVFNIAYCTLAMAECFSALDETDSAERYYEKTFAILHYYPPVETYHKFPLYISLVNFYTSIRKYDRAKAVLDTLLSDKVRASVPAKTLQNAWLRLYQVDSSVGNYSAALIDIRQYQQLHDSIINEVKNRQIAEMSVQNEMDRKNQHIADLEKQNTLATRLRNSLIGCAFLLALLTIGLYNRYRSKQRTNQLLQTRQQDIDASNRQLQQLLVKQEKLIREKEWLVREIHHRVKNNLQIVISLLHLQSEEVKDEIAISAFDETSSRINSISLVHKKLYLEGENLATIHMRDYVSELVAHLRLSFSQRRDIHFQLEVGPVFLDVAQAVPIGLLLNEAITNAMKYAFPSEVVEHPEICISLQELPPENSKPDGHAQGRLELTITDNGVGLNQAFDPKANRSLGMELIHTMAQQLEGTLTMKNVHGLAISVRFQRKETVLDEGAAA